ncbi:MAG: glycosyl hydrolase family 28-related protein [Caldilineaceae bacterium]
MELSAKSCRQLDQSFGFDQKLFEQNVGSQEFTLPQNKCTLAALQALLAAVGPDGGVIQIPACTLRVDQRIFLPSNVIFQGAGIGKTIFQAAADFDDTVMQVRHGSNVIIRDLTVDGGESAHLLVSAWYADNVLVERIEARHANGSGIHFRYAQRITVRYSESHHHKQWHGISSKDCFPTKSNVADAQECSQEFLENARNGNTEPGVLWSENYAVYSNNLHDNGDYGLDLHASTGEVAGNRIQDNVRGSKFPDAANVWIHHNQIAGSSWWGLFFYNTVDIGERASHNIAFYANTIGRNGLVQARIEKPAANIYFIDNTYTSLVNVVRNESAIYRCADTHDEGVFVYGTPFKEATAAQCKLSAIGKLFD